MLKKIEIKIKKTLKRNLDKNNNEMLRANKNKMEKRQIKEA